MQRYQATGRVISKDKVATYADGSRVVKIALLCEDSYVSASGEKHIKDVIYIAMWNRKADVSKYINVGDELYIEGKLTSFTHKVMLKSIHTLEVAVSLFHFIMPRKMGNEAV